MGGYVDPTGSTFTLQGATLTLWGAMLTLREATLTLCGGYIDPTVGGAMSTLWGLC